MGEDCTHGFCPRCNSFQPIVWRNVKVCEIYVTGMVAEFNGLEMVCRACDFEITKIGQVSKGKMTYA